MKPVTIGQTLFSQYPALIIPRRWSGTISYFTRWTKMWWFWYNKKSTTKENKFPIITSTSETFWNRFHKGIDNQYSPVEAPWSIAVGQPLKEASLKCQLFQNKDGQQNWKCYKHKVKSEPSVSLRRGGCLWRWEHTGSRRRKARELETTFEN